ncbi:MAG: peroxidase family protein [Acidimicrobiales bacterium]
MASTGRSTYHQSLFWRLFDRAATAVDRRVGWYKLPRPLGILVLIGVRDVLRKQNLHDTSAQPAVATPPVGPLTDEVRRGRSADGSYNDLAVPAMGMAGSRFGRNIPVALTDPEPLPALLEPSPRTVSRSLMTRHRFQPATAANALAASWLQFMIRDWFSHGESPADLPFDIDLDPDDPWAERPMTIRRTRPDPTRPPGPSNLPPTYVNVLSPWWDASSIYGTSAADQALIRTGVDGKLHLRPDGSLPYPTDPGLNPAMTPGFWLGLVMLQTLFANEHNAICDALKNKYAGLDDDDLFRHARLVNAALMAKIHTVEWTPAVISHPTTRLALRINWWGLAGERVHRRFGRISKSEVISGIPGSPTDHYGVPYSLTEEFVGVYRMHPLIPDDYSLRSVADDRLLENATLRSLAGPGALDAAARFSMTDLFYSFGTEHPGVVTLHNFPRFLQEFERPDGKLMDLAAVDILRAREQGVPRYNQFRRLMHLKPARSFADLTDNPEWARELQEVYGDIDRVDVMSGMYAERRPKGFAFSDTAFRIFVLMASRRLNSDRFFTTDYTAEIYTKAGLKWIDDNNMMTVLQRHHPQLKPAMAGVDNAFAAWARTGR